MDPKHSHGPDRLDYKETSDLTEVHAAIQREHAEPTADVTPMPLWLTGVCGAAICFAGMYLGIFHGGFRGDVFNERQSTPDLLFPQPAASGGAEAPKAELTLAELGKGIYANCQPCHQATGNGVPGQFPPLAKSEFVLGSEKRFVAILLKGLGGPVVVNGGAFNGAMPAWEKVLSDKKIAAVASFVRASFGNTGPEISEAKVKAARAEFAAKADPWTEAQLKEIPADATLPDDSAKAPAGQAPASAAVAAPTAPAPTAAPAGVDQEKVLALGKTTYMTICVVCHQPTGAGLPMVFPPLVKSPYVNGPAERFAAMILKGNIGAMTIDGKPFNGAMPPQEAVLTDEKIAAVASYVRANFGNSAPLVSTDEVKAARAKFAGRATSWTQPELDAWK